MKSKRIKILLVLTVVIQLLIPAYLLGEHYTKQATAMSQTEEYKFRILSIYFSDYSGFMNFYVGGIDDLYDKEIEVTVGEDGFADFSELKDKRKTDRWFDCRYCLIKSNFENGEYTFEEGVDVKQLKSRIRQAFSWTSDIHENSSFAYVTAKVYKGVFIPTAVFIEGEKVITINNESE